MINLGLTLLSALLGSLAFPNFINSNGYPLFAFLFLIPLFYVVSTSKLRYSWFLGALYGFVYYLIYNYWLKTFHPLAILIAPILESGQYLVVFMLLSLVSKLFKKQGYLALSCVYVAYLYVTSVPNPSVSAVYSGTSNDTFTCDMAAKLYISSGLISLINLIKLVESVISP